MSKIFLPASISLFAVAIIVVSLTLSGLIKGASEMKKKTEVKGTTISVTPIPTMTSTPTPTVEVKKEPTVYKQPVEQYVAPTAIPTPTPTIQKPDNNAQMQEIANQFKKIAELNSQIAIYNNLANNAANSSSCDPNKWSQKYLSNGDQNPNYVFNPADQNALYQQCLSNNSSYVGTYTAQIDGLKNQIRNVNNQIQGTIATCSGSECSKYYLELVAGFESKGFIVR